LDRL
jgi:hypothetical protein